MMRKGMFDSSGLSSALISDVLDARGMRNQVLPPSISRRVGSEMVFGYAATMQAVDTTVLPTEPYRKQIAATDALEAGDVVVASAQTSSGAAFWGELFSTAAIARGAVGAVIDGPIRDMARLIQMGFPVFATGVDPRDSMGRLEVASFGEPITVGSVVVRNGDLVVGDADGIVIVPREVSDAVIADALEKGGKEDGMRAALESGMRLGDAWREFRVL